MLATSQLFGQLNRVQTGQVVHETQSRPCVQIKVEPERKDVLNAFENYLKKNHDVKAGGGKLLSATEVSVPAISSKKMDLFATAERVDSTTVLKVFGRLGYDVYLGPGEYESSFQAMEELVRKFSREYIGGFYQDQLAAEQKVLAKAQKSEDKHQSSADKLKEKNEKAQEKIEALQEEVKENESELKELETSLEMDEKAIRASQNKLDRLQNKLQNLNSN